MTIQKAIFSINDIYSMRQGGASLQQIADQIGRTKERVRQILTRRYGSARHMLVSTEQLCRRLDLSRNRIIDLYEKGVITPKVSRLSGTYHFLLWPASTIEKIREYLKTHRLCKVCGRSIPRGKRIYCSQECYRDRQAVMQMAKRTVTSAANTPLKSISPPTRIGVLVK